MTRPDEIAALADEFDALVKNECWNVDVFGRVSKSLRLSATSPGDAVREALEESKHWHERADKALSKSGRGDADYHWRRSQHKEEIERIDAALAPAEKAGDGLVPYFERQIEWSRQTFGPALRTKGVIDHIRKELREIEAAPHDLSEWVDVIILAMDGFWRHGGIASGLLPALLAKQQKNMARTWPDWRSMSEDGAIEHDRTKDAATPTPPSADVVKVRWRHKKRGSTYTEIGRGKVQSEHWRDPNVDGDYDTQAVDMREVVVYRADSDGGIWVRPVEEFDDGRFALIQSAAHGGGTKSDGACLSSLPSGESELLVTAARAPSDPAQEPSVTTFGGSSPCFGRPGDARNTYVDAQEPDAVAYLHRHRKFGRDLQFTQLEACDREQGWTEQPLYRTTRDDLVSELRKIEARLMASNATKADAWDIGLAIEQLTASASALEAKDAEIARLKGDLDLQRSRGYELLATECEKQQSRISDLERQLAEEREQCAAKADAGQIHMRELSRSLPNGEAKQCAQICAKAASEIAAAIRGGAK